MGGVNVLSVPAAIYANIYDGELPFIKSNATPFGGHITQEQLAAPRNCYWTVHSRTKDMQRERGSIPSAKTR